MIRCMKRTAMILLSLLGIAIMAMPQADRQGPSFSIQGYSAEAPIIQVQGRALVDVQDLARITNGSLSFQKNRTILTLPHSDASLPSADDSRKSGFSPGFTRAGIEAMASIREWGGMLMITVQNGYPVGNTMAGNTIMAYEGRAADSVALASAAVSNDSDHLGLELLKNEFNNVQAWAERFISARNSLRAANLSVSEDAVKKDDEIQKLVHCGQFLAQTFAGGVFQDDGSCH